MPRTVKDHGKRLSVAEQRINTTTTRQSKDEATAATLATKVTDLLASDVTVGGNLTVKDGLTVDQGATIQGNLTVNGSGTTSFNGGITAANYTGQIEGQQITGSQINFISTIHQMNDIAAAGNNFVGTQTVSRQALLNLQATVNQLLQELRNSNYMA